MMAKWLPTNLSSNLPVYAHTMIGVGGLVVNGKDQILTIIEKQAIIPGAWKLPGGYVEPSTTPSVFIRFEYMSIQSVFFVVVVAYRRKFR